MRVNKRVLSKIITAVEECFGDVDIYLFGSRVDDTKKGGDIDIAIDTDVPRVQFRKSKAKTISNLIRNNFELKIDIVNYNTKDELLKQEIRNSSVKIIKELL